MANQKEPGISGSTNAILAGVCLIAIGAIFVLGARSAIGFLPLVIGAAFLIGGVTAKIRPPRN